MAQCINTVPPSLFFLGIRADLQICVFEHFRQYQLPEHSTSNTGRVQDGDLPSGLQQVLL